MLSASWASPIIAWAFGTPTLTGMSPIFTRSSKDVCFERAEKAVRWSVPDPEVVLAPDRSLQTGFEDAQQRVRLSNEGREGGSVEDEAHLGSVSGSMRASVRQLWHPSAPNGREDLTRRPVSSRNDRSPGRPAAAVNFRLRIASPSRGESADRRVAGRLARRRGRRLRRRRALLDESGVGRSLPAARSHAVLERSERPSARPRHGGRPGGTPRVAPAHAKGRHAPPRPAGRPPGGSPHRATPPRISQNRAFSDRRKPLEALSGEYE
jgi:hypothetical protein